MQIRELDVASGPVEDLRAFHFVDCAYAREVAPEEPVQAEDEAIAYMRHTPAGEPRPRFLAERDGRVVGIGALFVHGPSFVYAQIRVLPGERRQGVGAALLETLRRAAERHGAASFFAHHATADGAAFAAWAGAVDDQRDVRSRLLLQSAVLPAPVVPAGWTLRTWIGPASDELVGSYLRARAAMDDAPAPGGQVLGAMTLEELRDLEETCMRRGRPPRVTVALNAHGMVGAFTDIRHTPGSIDAAIDDSGTIAEARGLGLATAVKLVSLRRLREDAPQVERVVTMNAEANAAIRAINTRLGFVPVVTLTTTVLTL
jgi:GNAT superfamily N-acetyltransferase